MLNLAVIHMMLLASAKTHGQREPKSCPRAAWQTSAAHIVSHLHTRKRTALPLHVPSFSREKAAVSLGILGNMMFPGPL